jgi:hypothetical protein
MEKWADYLVTGVKYDADKKRIIAYEVWEDLGENVGPAFQMTWHEVAIAILRGKTFISATWGTTGWLAGAALELVVKTAEDATVRDNLRHLRAVP